jgi:hypothetical protein
MSEKDFRTTDFHSSLHCVQCKRGAPRARCLLSKLDTPVRLPEQGCSGYKLVAGILIIIKVIRVLAQFSQGGFTQ